MYFLRITIFQKNNYRNGGEKYLSIMIPKQNLFLPSADVEPLESGTDEYAREKWFLVILNC